jgi:uncharacterized phage protein (TIGR01671 family)
MATCCTTGRIKVIASVRAEYGKCGIYPIITSSVGQYSGLTDKHNRLVFERDIIKLVTADYEEITIVCEFGPVRRQIFENEVEITGFYFVRSNDGRKTFPITHNYLGKHDTEIWEVIGNRTENPELFTKND